MTRRTGAVARPMRERWPIRGNPEARRTMLEIAVSYDLLAERAEQRNKWKPKG